MTITMPILIQSSTVYHSVKSNQPCIAKKQALCADSEGPPYEVRALFSNFIYGRITEPSTVNAMATVWENPLSKFHA